jgi:hypothetical protein
MTDDEEVMIIPITVIVHREHLKATCQKSFEEAFDKLPEAIKLWAASELTFMFMPKAGALTLGPSEGQRTVVIFYDEFWTLSLAERLELLAHEISHTYLALIKDNWKQTEAQADALAMEWIKKANEKD